MRANQPSPRICSKLLSFHSTIFLFYYLFLFFLSTSQQQQQQQQQHYNNNHHTSTSSHTTTAAQQRPAASTTAGRSQNVHSSAHRSPANHSGHQREISQQLRRTSQSAAFRCKNRHRDSHRNVAKCREQSHCRSSAKQRVHRNKQDTRGQARRWCDNRK